MEAYPRTTRKLSCQFRMKRMVSVPTTWIKLWMIMAKLLLRASEMVSTSLVKRLMVSPSGWESKYPRGSFSMVWKRSRRMS